MRKAVPDVRQVEKQTDDTASKIDAKVLARELHKPVVRKFQRRKVMVRGVNATWAADLVEMQKFAKANKGYRYILTVIDVLSRYAWARPLKDKKTAHCDSCLPGYTAGFCQHVYQR